MLLLLVSLLLTGLDCLLGAPAGREVYRMPQSALKGIFSKPFIAVWEVVAIVTVTDYIWKI